MLTKPKSIVINNVDLSWAKLDAPVAPFGQPQWEIQLSSTDPSVFSELTELGMKMKDPVDGVYTVNLRRKAVKADGTAMQPVRLVDANKNPIKKRNGIGNGSKGNAIVRAYGYEFGGRKGTAFSLTAVQVTDLIEYVPGGIDFQDQSEATGLDINPEELF